MTTAGALERINQADFQLLATAVLSIESSAYTALIETGSNARGQTIKSPLDAFCQVPGSDPPRFILVEHTTTAKKNKAKDGNLETKWLADLKKAAVRAAEISEQCPTAEFTVVLTSSQRPTEKLVQMVGRLSVELGVDVDTWDQSRIARILDTSPEGHYLRWRYLGIDAELLSGSLLWRLCEQSLSDYGRFLGLTGFQVERSEESQLRRSLESGGRLHLLVGDSGLGKSTSLWRVAHEYQAAGGYALWIPAHYLRDPLTFETTLEQRLRDLYPSLMTGSTVLLRKIVSGQKPLLLIVDDPNRESNPTQIVSHLLSWMRPTQNASFASNKDSQGQSSGTSPYVVFCPLWPAIGGSQALGNESWCEVTFFGTFALETAVRAVQSRLTQSGYLLSAHAAEDLAGQLSHDPFLIGLFGDIIASRTLEQAAFDLAAAHKIALDVIGNYVEDGCRKAAQTSPYFRSASDFRVALARFGALLLEHRELAPTWMQCREWLKDSDAEDTAAVLNELARHSTLWRLQDEHGIVEARPTYRHDRLRQIFLVEAMEERLTHFASSATLQTADLALMGDPYFAETIGLALYHLALTGEQSCLWQHLRSQNPLALALAYRSFVSHRARSLNDNERACVILLRAQLEQWAREVSLEPGWETTIEAIGQAFHNTDDPTVAEIFEPLADHWAIGLALLRNGVLSPGSLLCIGWHWHHFDPARGPIIVQAKSHHRVTIISQLSIWLTRDFEGKQGAECWAGAIATTGVLEFGELIEPLSVAWLKVPQNQQKDYLPIFVWATLHCFESEFEKQAREFLDVLLNIWAGLSDKRQEERGGLSDRTGISYELNHIIFNRWPVDALQFLIDMAHIRPGLAHSIEIALSRVDSPLVLEFFIQQADDENRSEHSMFWLIDYWNDHWGRNYRRYLSSESLTRARELWQDESLNGKARRLAFRYWQTHPDGDDATLLRQVPPDAPFYNDALQTRIKRGDLTVVPELLPLLIQDSYLWHDIHPVWCPALKEATRALASSIQAPLPDYSDSLSNSADHLIRLLTHIPISPYAVRV